MHRRTLQKLLARYRKNIIIICPHYLQVKPAGQTLEKNDELLKTEWWMRHLSAPSLLRWRVVLKVPTMSFDAGKLGPAIETDNDIRQGFGLSLLMRTFGGVGQFTDFDDDFHLHQNVLSGK